MLPGAVQAVAVFLPATYLVSGLQRAMIDHTSVAGPRDRTWRRLVGCALIAFLISAQLFRWDPEAKAPRRAKLWAAAAIVPFLLLGAWETVNGDLAQPRHEEPAIHPAAVLAGTHRIASSTGFSLCRS